MNSSLIVSLIPTSIGTRVGVIPVYISSGRIVNYTRLTRATKSRSSARELNNVQRYCQSSGHTRLIKLWSNERSRWNLPTISDQEPLVFERRYKLAVFFLLFSLYPFTLSFVHTYKMQDVCLQINRNVVQTNWLWIVWCRRRSRTSIADYFTVLRQSSLYRIRYIESPIGDWKRYYCCRRSVGIECRSPGRGTSCPAWFSSSYTGCHFV